MRVEVGGKRGRMNEIVDIFIEVLCIELSYHKPVSINQGTINHFSNTDNYLGVYCMWDLHGALKTNRSPLVVFQ